MHSSVYAIATYLYIVASFGGVVPFAGLMVLGLMRNYMLSVLQQEQAKFLTQNDSAVIEVLHNVSEQVAARMSLDTYVEDFEGIAPTIAVTFFVVAAVAYMFMPSSVNLNGRGEVSGNIVSLAKLKKKKPRDGCHKSGPAIAFRHYGLHLAGLGSFVTGLILNHFGPKDVQDVGMQISLGVGATFLVLQHAIVKGRAFLFVAAPFVVASFGTVVNIEYGESLGYNSSDPSAPFPGKVWIFDAINQISLGVLTLPAGAFAVLATLEASRSCRRVKRFITEDCKSARTRKPSIGMSSLLETSYSDTKEPSKCSIFSIVCGCVCGRKEKESGFNPYSS